MSSRKIMSYMVATKIEAINNWEKIVSEMERRTRACLYYRDESEEETHIVHNNSNTVNSCSKSLATDNDTANGSSHYHEPQHRHHHHHHEFEHEHDHTNLLPLSVRMSGNLTNMNKNIKFTTTPPKSFATKVKNKQIKFCNLHKCKKSSKFSVPHRLNSQLVQSRLTKQLCLLKEFQFDEIEENFVENLCVKCKINYFEKQTNCNNINPQNCNNIKFEQHKDNQILFKMSRVSFFVF